MTPYMMYSMPVPECKPYAINRIARICLITITLCQVAKHPLISTAWVVMTNMTGPDNCVSNHAEAKAGNCWERVRLYFLKPRAFEFFQRASATDHA